MTIHTICELLKTTRKPPPGPLLFVPKELLLLNEQARLKARIAKLEIEIFQLNKTVAELRARFYTTPLGYNTYNKDGKHER